MEVFIQGVPERATENSLHTYFERILGALSLENWTCQKIRQKPFAKLIFLSKEDGVSFLKLYGRTQIVTTQRLKFKGRLLTCSESNRLDKFALRSLEMNRKSIAEQKAAPVKSTPIPPAKNDQILECAIISCGVWDYIGSDLFYRPHSAWKACGHMRFYSKSIVLTTIEDQRLDILFSSVEAVSCDGLTSAMALTLKEAPRFFQLPDPDLDSLIPIFQSLSIRNGQSAGDRTRLPALSKEHAKVAGTCLVYLVKFKNSKADEMIRALSSARKVPPGIRRHIKAHLPQEPYTTDFTRLLEELSPTSSILPFSIRFQLQKLAQNGYLPPTKVTALIPEVKDIFIRSGSRICVNVIRRLSQQLPYAGPDVSSNTFEVDILLESLKKIEQMSKSNSLYLDEPVASENVAVIHKATVTPAGVYLEGPEAESNNRVLRKYSQNHDYFLRVQFCDEDGERVQYISGSSNNLIFDRFRKVLNEGISIAGLHFSFLGFSHSSLRAQSCWFMAPFIYNGHLLFDREVIKDLGDFSQIRIPAKCAARIGQAFTDTRDAITLDASIVHEIPDVERNERIFSDGVGTISMEALEQVWDGMRAGKQRRPTVLQIRYQGAKGMLALDSGLKGKSIYMRPSMVKFRDSKSTDLEICATGYKPHTLYLNQQMIKILEDMGVEDNFFFDLQSAAVDRLRMTTCNATNAANFLRTQSVGEEINLPWFIKQLVSLHLSFHQDSFLLDVLETAVLAEVRSLKYKARIPVKDGYTLLGIMDETGFLNEDQIFCIVEEDGEIRCITGRVIITRSPALHPGDVQYVMAVAAPEGSPLLQLRNCICFSQKGSRDLPSKLSGGDLDGDEYHIIFDTKARPKRFFEPAEYAKETPLSLSRPVERQDMTDFFVTFMATDQLGRISNAHKIIADQSEKGTTDPKCILLAGMASTAVDYSKTGIPVDMSRMPKFSPFRPDFMAPGPNVEILDEKPPSFDSALTSFAQRGDDEDDFAPSRYYKSNKILGRLFRDIDERQIFENVQRHRTGDGINESKNVTSPVLEAVWKYILKHRASTPWQHHLDLARGIRDDYEENLLNIMTAYSSHPHRPLSEIEVFAGTILGKTGTQTIRQRRLCISMRERFKDDLAFTVRCMTRTPAQEQGPYDDGNPSTNKTGNMTGEASGDGLALCIACLAVGLRESGGSTEYGYGGRPELRSFARVAAAMCLRGIMTTKG